MATTLVRDLRANLSLGMSDEEFQRGMDGLRRTAPRDGEQIAGAFAKAFSRQLGAAFRSLPQAEITADTSEAQIKVNALRSSLRDLANKRIGIDIDSAAALGEMRAIEAELEGLQQTDDISVRADVSRALAALRSVQREVDKIGDSGDDVAGAFARSFSQRLGQAFRSLPQAQITADSSDATIKINQLRGALQELADKRVGLDIDSAAALAQMRAVKAELESLQQTDDIAVRADVTRALAELNAVEREVNKIDGETIRIDVDLKGAAAMEMASLIQGALSTLEATGPAKLAVVGAAIAALPAAAATAGGAITAVLGGALAAVGLAAAKGSAEAQDALARLREAAQEEAARVGQPFEKVWVTIVDVAQRELNRLGPVFRDALADLAPDVEDFVDQAGSSLEELTPAVESVQRAFSAMLQSLGPALPGIMADLSSGISAIADAVADNPETFTRMAQGLAAFAEWAGKVTAKAIEMAKVLQDNAGVVRAFFSAVSLPIAVLDRLGIGMVEVGKGADAMTRSVQTSAQVADAAGQRMAALAQAYGLAGDDSVEAAQKMLDSWSAAFTGFRDMGGALQTIEQRTRESVSGTNRQAQASERLAEVQRQAAERIQRAERDVADAHERATERVQQAQRQLADAHERAAERVADAQERVKDAQERVSEAVDAAARREAEAVERVEDARRRAAQVADDSSRKIAAAEKRVADAQADAAQRVMDAERRLQDSHARTADAIEDLTRARERAAERLEDLQRQTAGIELDEESAQLAIERARQRMEEINADPKASDLDRREADLAYRQALQRLDEVRQRNADLRKELAEAQQAGIEGSDEVVQAKQRIAQAQQAEQDAELALARARQDAARQVEAAEQALADARSEAARQQQDAQRELARAEAEVDQARIAGAKDVQKAKEDLARTEADAAKAARDAARDVADAEENLRKVKKDTARDIADAEAALTKARQDAARDVQKANADVAQSWTSLGGTVKVTTQEYLAELEKQVKAQEEWAANLVSLAGRVPDDMMAELVQMGPKGAEVVAMMTRMTEPELNKFIDLHSRSGKLAGDTFAKNLAEAGPILREIARQRGEEVADKVREGMDRGAVSVFEAARRIGLRITEEVGTEHKIKITADAAPAYGVLNQLLHDIGISTAQVSVGVLKNADGNIYMAGGGVLSFAGGTEQHIAQIAGPGTRIWAEPETQGEAYIPLAPSKRQRSEEILSKVAEMFGGAYVRPMPAGGMPVAGGDGASMGLGGISIGQIVLQFADDRDMYQKGAEFAAGLREYVRRGGVMPR